MELSNRITGLAGGGAAWGVFFRARRMAAAGDEITELTIGEHDVRTAPGILDEMHRAARAGHTGYADIPGVAELRAAVADRVTRMTGVATTPANVLITPGGQAGLFAAHMAVLDPGQTGLHIDPYYATYPGTIAATGATALAVPTRPEDGFLPRPGALAAAAETPGARSLLINTPNNPTGAVYPRTTLEEIAAVCADAGLWLISDEVYDSQVWEGDHVSPRALPGMEARTLVVGSMSKSHAMTGSRVGWIVGPETAIAHLGNLAITTTYGVPGYIQDAATYALAQGPDLEEKIAAPFARRRRVALAILSRQNRVRPVPSQGAMYLMLDIRATGLSGLAFADRLLDARRIAVMPGESFGRAAAGHVRIALTVDDDRLAAALSQLLEFAQEIAP